jgi:hypothetical protein
LCFLVVFSLVSWFLCACLLSCLSLLSQGQYNKAARRRQLNLKTYWTIQCRRMLKYNIVSNVVMFIITDFPLAKIRSRARAGNLAACYDDGFTFYKKDSLKMLMWSLVALYSWQV